MDKRIPVQVFNLAKRRPTFSSPASSSSNFFMKFPKIPTICRQQGHHATAELGHFRPSRLCPP